MLGSFFHYLLQDTVLKQGLTVCFLFVSKTAENYGIHIKRAKTEESTWLNEGLLDFRLLELAIYIDILSF